MSTVLEPEPATRQVFSEPEPGQPLANYVPPPRQTVMRDLPGDDKTQAPGASPTTTFYSDHIEEIVSALALATLDFGDVEAKLTAHVESRRTGVKFDYEYESLADVLGAVRAPLAKQGLVLLQFPTVRVSGNNVAVTVMTMLAHKSGQWFKSWLTLPSDADAQALGSAISYARRYAVKAMLGIAPSRDEDDDGNRASGNRVADPPKAGQRKSQTAAPASDKTDKPASAAAKPVDTKPLSPIGLIETLSERDGVLIVRLVSGFTAATRNPDIVGACKRHKEDGTAVELATRPASDPKYLPNIEEVSAQHRGVEDARR